MNAIALLLPAQMEVNRLGPVLLTASGGHKHMSLVRYL